MPATKQDINYSWIAKALKNGRVVPFLGAGASIGCGLPSGRKLAEILVSEGEFPDQDGRDNLALVASYLAQIRGDSNVLKDLLREHLSIEAKPGILHECLASIKALQLIVTTNYDDLIEQALAPRQPWIVVDRGEPGNVWLRLKDRAWEEVEAITLQKSMVEIEQKIRREKITEISKKMYSGKMDENEAKILREKANEPKPIIFKMHGSLDRTDRRKDAFLITEEQYVDFLGRPKHGLIPPMLEAMMQGQNFLFLGYGLKDWNVRVMLRKLMLMRPPADNVVWWAIVREASASEKELWGAHNVRMYEVELDEFAKQLQDQL
jgi:SIR2-like domain